MFKFSTKTQVNKEYKLTDFFKQMNASKEVKKDASCIEKITLTNVLSPLTLNCEADNAIKEVYVFEIKVNTQAVPELFIKKLDSNIKLHTLFVIKYDNLELMMLSYKIATFKGKYCQTNWESGINYDVPLVNSVPELYKFILSKFLNYPPFENEDVDAYVKRNNALNRLDLQISKTESAIAYETQSKKRFEYNAKLKKYKEEREKLLGNSA